VTEPIGLGVATAGLGGAAVEQPLGGELGVTERSSPIDGGL